MIVAFGNPVYDYIKTPSVTTGERVLSGCSTNACLALARLGHATMLVGRVGLDYYERFLADAERCGKVISCDVGFAGRAEKLALLMIGMALEPFFPQLGLLQW